MNEAVRMLCNEAIDANDADRFAACVDAAARAGELARQLGDLPGEVEATYWEATGRRMLGDDASALPLLTRVLTLANDPATTRQLGDPRSVEMVARAHGEWVGCARFLPSIPAASLHAVLDAGERFVVGAGRPMWRANLLLQRAMVHEALGEPARAIAAAEEALALILRDPSSPGTTLACYRWSLGDLLLRAGRPADARPHYAAVLADRASGDWDRKVAEEGLGHCAFALGDPKAALAHARAAVALAEPLGPNALTIALRLLIFAHRTAGQPDEARAASQRHVALARGLGPNRLHFALRDALDLALDAGNADDARALFAEYRPLAEQAHRSQPGRGFDRELADLQARLEALP